MYDPRLPLFPLQPLDTPDETPPEARAALPRIAVIENPDIPR
jgi:hypothetical protein